MIKESRSNLQKSDADLDKTKRLQQVALGVNLPLSKDLQDEVNPKENTMIELKEYYQLS
jgi:hypothetical protein